MTIGTFVDLADGAASQQLPSFPKPGSKGIRPNLGSKAHIQPVAQAKLKKSKRSWASETGTGWFAFALGDGYF